MVKISQKQMFNLLVKEINEIYAEPDEYLNNLKQGVLQALRYDAKFVLEDCKNSLFLSDDDELSPTEHFLLNWIENEWVKKDGNPELYDKLSEDLYGGRPDLGFYETELPAELSINIIYFSTLVSEIHEVLELDEHEILAVLFYKPERLWQECQDFYFRADDGRVDDNEGFLLDWIQTQWIENKEEEERNKMADEISIYLAQKTMNFAAKRIQLYY